MPTVTLAARIWICMLYLCSNYRDSSSNRYPCPSQLFFSCTTRIRNISSVVKALGEALSLGPIKPVFLDFSGEMLRSDEHHPPLAPYGVPSATMLSRGAAAKLTPRPAGYCACRADTIFPSPPPRWQQLMTAAILKIKQEIISIGDVVADRKVE